MPLTAPTSLHQELTTRAFRHCTVSFQFLILLIKGGSFTEDKDIVPVPFIQHYVIQCNVILKRLHFMLQYLYVHNQYIRASHKKNYPRSHTTFLLTSFAFEDPLPFSTLASRLCACCCCRETCIF